MIGIWKKELDRFSSLVKDQQVIWLSNLMFLLTIFARDTYSTDSDEVNDPVMLRRFNELMHRLIAQQMKIASGEEQRFSDEMMLKIIEDELNSLGVDYEYVIKKLQ